MDSSLKRIWDLTILALVLVSIIIISFQFAFLNHVTWCGSMVVYSIDLFFIADFFYRNKNEGNLKGRIGSNSKLVLDFITSVPFDALFFLWPGMEIGGIPVILWVRLIRLMRMSQLFSILSNWQKQSWINPGYLRIVKFVSTILILIHLISCSWYLSAYFAGFPDSSWVMAYENQFAEPVSAYIKSLYWTVTTATTVGYGDITPHLNYEYVISIIVMMLGASMYALIIGNIASFVSKLDIQKTSYWSRVDSIKVYLSKRGVHVDLRKKILNDYDYMWEQKRGIDEKFFFNDLPDPLKYELVTELAGDLLETVPLFKFDNPALKRVLVLALNARTYNPGSVIVNEGESGSEIYFISKGGFDVINPRNRESLCILKRGDYFGDISLLLGEKRTASVIAVSFCEVFELSFEDFQQIKNEYPEFREVLKKMSSENSESRAKMILEGIVL